MDSVRWLRWRAGGMWGITIEDNTQGAGSDLYCMKIPLLMLQVSSNKECQGQKWSSALSSTNLNLINPV